MKNRLAISLCCFLVALNGYADPNLYKLNLSKSSTITHPQTFYCTALPRTTNMDNDPLVTIVTYGQMVTGFKSNDPQAIGQIRIPASELNKIYFKAYHDPAYPKAAGFIAAVGTQLDIICQIGTGTENRQLMLGDYGFNDKRIRAVTACIFN